MINIAIFASGSGSNAEQIIKHFKDSQEIKVSLVLSNNPEAFVLQRAAKYNIPAATFSRDEFYETEAVIKQLQEHKIDFIVLAGFLWLIPASLIKHYSDRIINIHPALLPKYGGKGMYGSRVHQAVLQSGDRETGITIHFVNEKYDDGAIIFQKSCQVHKNDTPELIQQRVHDLEYEHFPKTIEKVIREKFGLRREK